MNDSLMSEFNDLDTIPFENISKHERWIMGVSVYDDIGWSRFKNSSHTIIKNTKPSIENLIISTPHGGHPMDNVTCSFKIIDQDLDNLSVNYSWYNGTDPVAVVENITENL